MNPSLQIKDPSIFAPQNAQQREWLETNGLGGYASSTIIGMNTRRYHGLLVVDHQAGRWVLLSKIEEDLIIDGQRLCLSTNQYQGALYPQGYEYIQRFELRPHPVWVFNVNGLEIEKSLMMVDGQDVLVVEYKLLRIPRSLQKSRIHLELRPLTAFRDYHSTTHQNNFLNPNVNQSRGLLSFKPYPDLPEIFISHQADQIMPGNGWYKNFYYEREEERGLGFQEDLFNPCVISYDLKQSNETGILVSLQPQNVLDLEIYRDKEILRREKLPHNFWNKMRGRFNLAADQFIISRGEQRSIVAGYHWFADWGRDTMIALPGLTLYTGRFKDAEDILLSFSKLVDRGMLPNRFGDSNTALEYNTVDAALWYFEAIRQYGQYTKKWHFIKKNLYDVLKSIIEAYKTGTRYNIHMDVDGLIYCGQEGVQLTWMDAKVGDRVITPRYGKPVEIQALWFNALCIMEDLARRFKLPSESAYYQELAQKAKLSFNQMFWNENQNALYDVVNGTVKDDSIRPNQILTISLGYAILDPSRFKAVLSLVEKELLTPYGLRTLNQSHPDYVGIYQGNPAQRDSAYHQGTVWPWLLGPYIRALVKSEGDSRSTRIKIRQTLKPIQEALNIYGLGQLGEIFDGDAPFVPRGCIAQAWSVAQISEILHYAP